MEFNIEGGYRPVALDAYGHKCEWVGCGWDQGSCDVHHIDYQEQWAMEAKFRALLDGDHKFNEPWFELQREAEVNGWGTFSPKTRQLQKNDAVTNLTVLCPNHHRYVHTQDLGMKVLQFIPKRKAGV